MFRNFLNRFETIQIFRNFLKRVKSFRDICMKRFETFRENRRIQLHFSEVSSMLATEKELAAVNPLSVC